MSTHLSLTASPSFFRLPDDQIFSIVDLLGEQDLRVLDCVHRFFRSDILNSVCELRANQKQMIPERPFRLFHLANDQILSIMDFVGEQGLRILDCVHRVFQLASLDKVCKSLANRNHMIPTSLLTGVGYKQFFLHLFSNAIGPDVIRESLGEVDEVPLIPLKFIRKALEVREHYKLVYHPEHITISVDENSPLALSEEVEGKLIETEPTGEKKRLQANVTPNNTILLAQKYVKKDFPIQFAGLVDDSTAFVIEQHGDKGARASHWSCQRVEPLEWTFDCYQRDFDGVSLIDRLVFHLFSYNHSGKIPQICVRESTSTLTKNNSDSFWNTTIWWAPRPQDFRLYFGIIPCNKFAVAIRNS